MKTWNTPDLMVEEYELNQAVAYGCSTIVEIKPSTPGGSISFEAGCYDANKGWNQGNGHWRYTTNAVDTNGNGKIDWPEWVNALETARNGQTTGEGHANHSLGGMIGGIVVPSNGFSS